MGNLGISVPPILVSEVERNIWNFSTLPFGWKIDPEIMRDLETAIAIILSQNQWDLLDPILEQEKNLGRDWANHPAVDLFGYSLECRSIESARILAKFGSYYFRRDSKSGKTYYHNPARDGDLDLLQSLYQMGLPGWDGDNRRNFRKYRPIEVAIHYHHLECAKFLYSIGAPIISQQPDRVSCLQIAAATGNYEIVKWLLEEGCSPASRPTNRPVDDRGRNLDVSPLMLAIKSGNLSTAQLLYSAAPELMLIPTSTGLLPFHFGLTETTSVPMLKWLMETQFNFDCLRSRIPRSDWRPGVDGILPIHLLTRLKLEDAAMFLLQLDPAAVGIKDKHNRTALDYALPHDSECLNLRMRLQAILEPTRLRPEDCRNLRAQIYFELSLTTRLLFHLK